MATNELTIEKLKELASQMKDAQHKRLIYTTERIPEGGSKSSLKSAANRLRNALEEQQYYKDEGVRDFLQYVEKSMCDNADSNE